MEAQKIYVGPICSKRAPKIIVTESGPDPICSHTPLLFLSYHVFAEYYDVIVKLTFDLFIMKVQRFINLFY